MRSYVHDDHKTQDLFAGIVNRLSDGGAHTDMIQGLLKDVCEFFRFGRGLIYETDHTGAFNLKEHYSASNHYEGLFHHTLRLTDHLSPDDIQRLKDDHIFIVQPTTDPAESNGGRTRLLTANSLLMTPVLSQGKLVGLVAMMDRRHEILIDDSSVEAAKTVLKLLANHVLTRYTQRRLTYARKSLNSILDHMGIDIYVSDFGTYEVLFANRTLAAPHGGWEKMLGRRCWEAVHGFQDGPCPFCPRPRLLDESGLPTRAFSWDYQRPADGAWFRVFNAAFQWTDGRLAHVVSSVDITENKRNEETIHRLAFFDQLTRLPNRRKLEVAAEEIMTRQFGAKKSALSNNPGIWLLFFDLDNFKNVNDTMGHQAGDELLAQVGRLMEATPETRGRCYRLGGDEFVLFYENVSRRFVHKIIDFLLENFDRPWDLPTGRPVCRASIGVARYPEDGEDLESLLYQADLAMYQAKEAGKGRACFSDGELVGPKKKPLRRPPAGRPGHK